MGKPYTCFIEPNTPLPMMYMPDCLRASWELMNAPRELLKRRTYNLTAMSFTPHDLESSIRAVQPSFKVAARCCPCPSMHLKFPHWSALNFLG
jgi:threonine 3-dehydrogenase